MATFTNYYCSNSSRIQKTLNVLVLPCILCFGRSVVVEKISLSKKGAEKFKEQTTVRVALRILVMLGAIYLLPQVTVGTFGLSIIVALARTKLSGIHQSLFEKEQQFKKDQQEILIDLKVHYKNMSLRFQAELLYNAFQYGLAEDATVELFLTNLGESPILSYPSYKSVKRILHLLSQNGYECEEDYQRIRSELYQKFEARCALDKLKKSPTDLLEIKKGLSLSHDELFKELEDLFFYGVNPCQITQIYHVDRETFMDELKDRKGEYTFSEVITEKTTVVFGSISKSPKNESPLTLKRDVSFIFVPEDIEEEVRSYFINSNGISSKEVRIGSLASFRAISFFQNFLKKKGVDV